MALIGGTGIFELRLPTFDWAGMRRVLSSWVEVPREAVSCGELSEDPRLVCFCTPESAAMRRATRIGAESVRRASSSTAFTVRPTRSPIADTGSRRPSK
jgi:hypothetical protein